MKIYRCQFCNYNVTPENNKKSIISAKHKMGEHYENKHKDLLPEDIDGFRWFYYTLTKKNHGECVICHNNTEFNKITMKYSRFCDNPQCKQKYKEERDKRMIAKYGKVCLLNDEEKQRQMLENRKISGVYTWSDGTKIKYVGSYELDFLKFLNTKLNWVSSDIFGPSPHTYEYEVDGKKHIYIPDFFIPSLNCEIEIKSKDRMDRQNSESRAKEIEKDKLMKSCSNLFNYIIIFDKDYTEFNKLIQKDQ